MLGFCVTAPILDVFAKLATDTTPVMQIASARFIVQAAIMLPVLVLLRHAIPRDPSLRWPLVRRALFLGISTYCFVAATNEMPIADALAIAFVEPFILLILGKFLFGDEVGMRRIIASVVGFGGSLLVIQPSLVTFGLVALYPLGTALCFALYMLETRSLSRKMHPIPMQFATSVLTALFCSLFVGVAWIGQWDAHTPVMPEGVTWLWLFGVGAASALAHIMMTYALRFAPSATLAPLHYLEIISAAILGLLVFQDFPNTLTWAGIAIIVSSGLYIIHRERLTEKGKVRLKVPAEL
ncbi:MAG: DMT family transporter [Marivivens sp.]|nr:DMT family transporter [Marivivens sp.]NVK07388.1 DMT family transporter [Marivivens sp.]